MLTEEIIIDQISVDLANNVSVRQATIIKRDGVEISKQYHRVVLAQGDDISAYDAKVQAICAAAWSE
jgi:hypothetical protein